jgi:hypothetical protein
MALTWDLGDPEVDAFVDANLVSFSAWDLIVYLNRNPATCETLEGLTTILARQESDLAPVLRRLADNGVLLEEAIEGGHVCYRMVEDADVRRVVARFVDLAGKRDRRLEFVRRVLANLTAE